MDETKTYINMANCPEIQGHREFKPSWHKSHTYKLLEKGDYYVRFGRTENVELYCGSFDEQFDDNIWLPRQDQLQEIMKRELEDLVEGLWRFISDTDCDNWECWFEYIKQFTSMEQLWLAFVMKENHNKVRDGEDWKEESK